MQNGERHFFALYARGLGGRNGQVIGVAGLYLLRGGGYAPLLVAEMTGADKLLEAGAAHLIGGGRPAQEMVEPLAVVGVFCRQCNIGVFCHA